MGASQEYDSILLELGEFGRYQIRQYAYLSLPIFFCAAFSVSYIFTASVVPHRCLLSECGDVGERSPFNPSWLPDAVPFERDPSSSGQRPTPCFSYKSLLNNASSDVEITGNQSETCQFDNSSRTRCDSWVFKGRERTIQSDFSLTCPENEWKLTLVGTINSVGRLIGLPLNGYVADRYGRKTGLIFTLLGSAIFGLARGFSPNYEAFLTFEFLEAIFSGGIYGIAFIMGMELVGPNKRVLGGAVIVWSYALGEAMLGFLAWLLRDWQYLLYAIYSPALLFTLYIWLIPESVRWLMSRGRLSDARRIIFKAAETNNVELSEPLTSGLQKWDDSHSVKPSELTDEEEKHESIWASLRQVCGSRGLLLRLANCSFCWITNTLVFYGLSLNAVWLGGTSRYLSFVLVSLVEAPAYILAWQGMMRLGRRPTLCAALCISGVACIASTLMSNDVWWAQVALYMVGKFAITASFDTLYVYTAEMFPTKLRTSLMSACSMVGRLGSMLAPQTPLLAQLSPLLPLSLFGVVAIIAAFLSLLFPETRNRSLPDSVRDAENIGIQEIKHRDHQQNIQ